MCFCNAAGNTCVWSGPSSTVEAFGSWQALCTVKVLKHMMFMSCYKDPQAQRVHNCPLYMLGLYTHKHIQATADGMRLQRRSYIQHPCTACWQQSTPACQAACNTRQPEELWCVFALLGGCCCQ